MQRTFKLADGRVCCMWRTNSCYCTNSRLCHINAPDTHYNVGVRPFRLLTDDDRRVIKEALGDTAVLREGFVIAQYNINGECRVWFSVLPEDGPYTWHAPEYLRVAVEKWQVSHGRSHYETARALCFGWPEWEHVGLPDPHYEERGKRVPDDAPLAQHRIGCVGPVDAKYLMGATDHAWLHPDVAAKIHSVIPKPEPYPPKIPDGWEIREIDGDRVLSLHADSASQFAIPSLPRLFEEAAGSHEKVPLVRVDLNKSLSVTINSSGEFAAQITADMVTIRLLGHLSKTTLAKYIRTQPAMSTSVPAIYTPDEEGKSRHLKVEVSAEGPVFAEMVDLCDRIDAAATWMR